MNAALSEVEDETGRAEPIRFGLFLATRNGVPILRNEPNKCFIARREKTSCRAKVLLTH